MGEGGGVLPPPSSDSLGGGGGQQSAVQVLEYLGTLPLIIATIKRPPGKEQKLPRSPWDYWQPL